jgi:RHS repeat-associated protein
VQGQILAEYDAGAWEYILPDALGSVRQVIDAAGQVSLAQGYDPFGNLLEQVGVGQSGFGYTGEQEDPSTGLIFLRARYYEPMTGRFLSEDTKPGIAYQPKSLHIYMYAWNNPVLLTDPSGLQPPPPARHYLNYPTAEEVVQTSSSNVLGLIRLFEIDHFPGNNAKERLQWILKKTTSFPGTYLQFSLFPPGDSGFCVEFADERFYTDPAYWAEFVTKHESPQIGHFLTAVALGFNPEGAHYQAYLLDFFVNRLRAGPGQSPRLPVPIGPEMYALHLIVGHEMVGDTETLMGLPRIPPQYYSAATSEEAVGLFLKAVEADKERRFEERDEYFYIILGFSEEAVRDPKRIGNSMPDLRLSAKGWRFGREIRSAEIPTRRHAANWLRIEVYDPTRTR